MNPKSARKLLLVEDNQGDARLLREMLSEQGSHHTELVHVGCMVDAEEYLADHAVDIILLDLGLPDAQGLAVVRRAHAAAPRVPVVVLTGLDDESLATQALQQGAQDYLIKGQIETRGFLRALRYAVERKIIESVYRGLLEAAPDAMVVVNQSGEIVLLNLQAEKRFGYYSDELLGQQVTNIIPEGFAERLLADDLRSAEDALAQQIGTGIELTGRRKDGSEFPIEIMLSPVESTEGILVTAAIRDISVRKTAEKHLAQMEGRYRGLLEAAPDAMVVVNQRGEIVLLNVQAEKQFGYHRDELVGQQVKNIIPEGFAERLLADDLRSAEDALAQQIGTGIELTGRRKDGSDFPIEIMLSPLASAEGILVTAAIRDISQRKRGEEALQKSEGRLQRLMESSIIGIAIGTLDGQFIDGNDAFSKLLGYNREDFLSGTLRWDEMTPGRYHAVDQRAIEQLRTKGVAAPWEKEFIRKDGGRVSVLIGAVTLTTNAGEIEAVSFVVDLSERKQLEQQLRMAQKMEAVGQLAGGIAHDFNNLIGVIIGYSDIVYEKLHEADPLRAKIEEVIKAGRRAAALTRQLLAFSRQQVLEPKILNLNSIVTDMHKMLPRLIGENIELPASLAPDLGYIRADRGQIEQIIMNLAVNARDAMPDGGKLTIETANAEFDEYYALRHSQVVPGSFVMLAVTDTGVGMDAETQAHIFEPFFTTKEQGKGTGLGLATVYGVVKQSGGFVWLYSEPGHGTTFKIYLPRVQGQAETEQHSIGSDNLPKGTETVLLVEDEESLSKLTREMLLDSGYSVLVARNGVEALEVAQRCGGSIDLLLTDVVMPKMGGPALAKQLSVLRPDMKLLYMSGYTRSAAVTQELAESGSGLLQKPFTRGVLTRKVRDVLDTRR